MKDADKALMDRLNTLIELNFDHPAFGTEDICRELGVSRSHLYRVVKEHTQLSTSLYIRHIKLIKAKEWLQSPDMKIAEIAYKLGIDSPQNFSKYFTKEFGLTPTDYRKNHAAMPVAEQAVVPETVEEPVLPLASNRKVTTTRKYLYMGLGLLCLLAVGLTAFLLKTKMKDEPVFPENSIAIMPFKNMGSRERLLFRRTDAASTPGNFSALLPQLNVGGVTIVKMKGGKIAREQDFTDNLEFMQQLGVIPR